ncbi:calcium-translocating P-type ATPase, SERCA-type [Clostridium estertheticum]|uniref:calcium-translocating P-type ATPase, SERCA-type n=1 Tax=Clostridium estertheticum TaxID=238834 RepID=UPI0009FFAF50|nr:calcium-translocating P-type ATPase, SERCA-type [Clostridium estertheticum]MBU3170160.1 calcium-translocating P-type ATPase, SERCA-type [Clostridium estertheticum]MBZ9617062.1 calcium-translocating P-type ATPase, SERCA-type [Clostridium estertheticum subsp. laramiense]WAG76065.1 calcium-translocating P-type ATPase, SERCA-type [Clostridium estertheticum]
MSNNNTKDKNKSSGLGYDSITSSKGLTNADAESRLKKYGFNKLESKKKISALQIFISQFNDFITWILIVATVLSGLMGEKADAITIFIIVIMNGILGFIQEFKTEKSLEALSKLAAPTAKVVRNGGISVIDAIYLVPGDLVILESGDRIPADCILNECNNIMLDESLLTGESAGVSKSASSKENTIYMGTIILTGKAKAKVIATGMSTEMGKIADMLHSIDNERSPLKERLAHLGKILVILCIIICFVVTFMGIWRGQDKYEMFLLGVSLAVAAIPEGLTAIVTVALALGVSRMLKRNALVRKLPAVETLGCTSVICTDKTGTLTENNMTVKAFYFDGQIYNVDNDKIPFNLMMKKAYTYCNDCNYDFSERNIEKCLFGDPTETALIKGFFNNSKDLQEFLNKARRVYEIAFNSTRKIMSVIVKEDGREVCYVKGAPERVIEKCNYILIDGLIQPMLPVYKNKLMRSVEAMSNKALRCMACAYKVTGIVHNDDLESNLIFIGVAGIIDPPRKEVKDAVIKCKIAGIRPIMITGDHKNTAYAIGKDLEICKSPEEVITGDELDKLSDKELDKNIDNLKIFARVSPKHKLRIVKAFKHKNYIVAMTGDGVNDAPAIKEADIGIAMGISGTDVTKEASSMILLDDNFATIVSAVEEGRVIYNNIRKFIRYLLSCNLGEVLTMFLASLFYLENPLLPIQILFVNLVTDGLPAIALGVDPADTDIMLEKPRGKNESVFSRGLTEKIIIRGCLIGVCTILSFIGGKYYGMSIEACRTLALGTLVLSQLIHVFECRSEKHSLFEINPFTNMYLLGAVSISVIMLLSIVYIPFLQSVFHTIPLNLGQWLIVLFFSGIISFINSLYLYLTNKH